MKFLKRLFGIKDKRNKNQPTKINKSKEERPYTKNRRDSKRKDFRSNNLSEEEIEINNLISQLTYVHPKIDVQIKTRIEAINDLGIKLGFDVENITEAKRILVNTENPALLNLGIENQEEE